jgi:hypothetical protein
MNQQQAAEQYREIAARWRPYLEAVGIDTGDWLPHDIFTLAQLVRRDKDVEKAGRMLSIAWSQERRATAENEPSLDDFAKLGRDVLHEHVMTWVPPNLTLQAVHLLPLAKKATLKSRVLNARARNTLR